MTNVRLSPSGPEISNSGGAPLSFGPGARLRLTEGQVVMGGSQAIPVSPVDAVIGPDGFGDPDATVLTLSAPKEDLQYRAKLSLDVVNLTTNAAAQVVLYLDTSVDDGATYTNRAKCVHILPSIDTGGVTGVVWQRNIDVYLPLILGTSLGVDDTAPTANLKLRARANVPVGAANVSSLATSGGGGGAVAGCQGTIHIELEECF